MVERKGIGHPDSLIDGVMEHISRDLSRYYLKKFGFIRHHNVDKGLICGGATEVDFGGGHFTKPIKIILSGRTYGDAPVQDIANRATRNYLKQVLPNLDIDNCVEIQSTITEIWPSWDELSQRAGIPLANDTSIGVGYAPLTETERLVKEVEVLLSSKHFKQRHPFCGEDTKVMGLRCGNQIELTIAIAMLAKYIGTIGEYSDSKRAIRKEIVEFAKSITTKNVQVNVNSADNEETGSIYLTLSGTSAEMGDDGSVGRGNRANGLITPFRPMTLEATAGKNPVSHPGKIYSILAFEIAERVAKEFPLIENVDVYLLSRIGQPIDMPANASVLINADQKYFRSVKKKIRELVEEEFTGITTITGKILAGLPV